MPAAVETMAYVESRGLPWHGEGTAVQDLQTADEMIVAAGLDWTVSKREMVLMSNPGVIVPGRYAIVRDSDNAVLGDMGNAYRPIQNREAFTFADSLVDDGQAKYETAGALHGGATVFLSMELNHLELRLDGEHPDGAVKTYLLLSNGHNGRALEADITKVRVVCANTLNIAVKGAQRRFRIRHTGSIETKMLAAREALGIAFAYEKAFDAAAAKLMTTKLVQDQVLAIFRKAVWPVNTDKTSEEALENHPSTLAFENYLNSANLDPIRGTAWGALNAVAEFVDHEVKYGGRVATAADVRTSSILWGTAQTKKQAAFDALVKVR